MKPLVFRPAALDPGENPITPESVHALRRRRSRPAPSKRPARALVGSGMAAQLRVLPERLNEPAVVVIGLKLLFTRETVEPKTFAQFEMAAVPSVVKMSVQV